MSTGVWNWCGLGESAAANTGTGAGEDGTDSRVLAGSFMGGSLEEALSGERMAKGDAEANLKFEISEGEEEEDGTHGSDRTDGTDEKGAAGEIADLKLERSDGGGRGEGAAGTSWAKWLGRPRCF